MKLFVGLGNPGAKYRGHRHNIGFMALDAIAAENDFGPWRAKFQGQLAEGKLGTEKVLLLKPETFMNLSGQSVAAAMRFYKIPVGDVSVFHDELDLAPGKVRIKTGGGHAGHNGLRSLHQHIGAEFQRVRMGIGHPGDKRLVSNHVLGDFAKADQQWLEPVLRAIGDGAADLAQGAGDRLMNRIANALTPPRKKAEPAQPAAKPPAPGTAQPEAPQAEDTRSPLQRLIDKFS